MEKCYDIKDNEVTQFILGEDGIVYGVTESGSKETLASECCIRMGYDFDPDLIACYWSKPCEVEGEIKILISPEGEDGVLFQIDENETCTLDIEFDYLFQFNCSDMLNCQDELFSSVTNKSQLTYELESKSSLVSDNEYQISILQDNLNQFVVNTTNNINNTKLLIDDLNKSIESNTLLINDYNVKITYTKSETLIASYQKQIDDLKILNSEYSLKIDEYNKEIDMLNLIITQQRTNVNKSISQLTVDNNSLLKEVSQLSKDISELNATLNSYTLINLLTKPIVKVSLEKLDDITQLSNKNISFESITDNYTVIEETIYEITDIVSFFSGNNNTGIYFIDDNSKYCDALEQIIIDDLGDDAVVLNDNSFNSSWLHYKISITDESIIEDIKNKKLKLGIKIENNPCEMSVLLDNIKFNRICEVIEHKETVITENPSFNLKRVIDNKKSWVNYDTSDYREFELLDRETAYKIKHHKLGINTKEVDISISSASAIESDVMDFIIDNPEILGSLSGILTTNIFESGLTKEEFLSILYSELIDVKSRQTISDYPLLKMLYENYLNSLELINVQSSRFKYKDMFGFIKLIGAYWVDLVEQVIPSTTIWGSTYKFNNTIFDNNKFKYKKGTLFSCKSKSTPLPIIGQQNNVEVITIGEVRTSPIAKFAAPTPTVCNGVYMVQTNDSSEFIGSVKVLGRLLSTNIDEGDIIILNESDKSVLQKNN